MDTVGKALSAPLKLVGLVPKMAKVAAPLPTPTRDMAATAIASDDAMKRRRGGAADILTGRGGAEAATGSGKSLLGQ